MTDPLRAELSDDLDPLALPGDDAAWQPYVGERSGSELARAALLLAELRDGAPRAADEVLALWNEADLAVRNAGAIASVMLQLHPQEAVRTLCEEREQEVQRFVTERGLDRELYDVLDAVEEAGLDEQATRLLRKSLLDFRRSGVDQPEDVRTRLRELADRETVLAQEFSRNIRDDVRTVRLTPDRLDGLPQDFIDAHPVDDEGLVTLSTDYPDVFPFRAFAHDADARRELVSAFLNRAWPQNDSVLIELLDVRAERAKLLGYASWPDFDAEVKMVRTGTAIAEFIERIAQAADEPGRRDFEVLLERARKDDPDATAIDASGMAYYPEQVRRERFDVDAQQVRQYFDFQRVRAGLLDVTSRLFGIEYRLVDDVPTWHEDVTVYDVIADGARRGRIYLDLHPRPGKFKHAAQFDLVVGVSGRQLAEGVLGCNFSRGLMEHTEVVTLFHEFGHLVHHVLAGHQKWARFSGVATEWDFVEAPSQMLEEWAWDADILQTFARNANGEPIPRELVARMQAAKEFGKGYLARTQMYYAAMSYQLHVARPDDLLAKTKELQARYDLFRQIEGTHMYASFGHLEGYTSGYYTYMWSLVIAKDMFSAFDRSNLFDTSVSYRYRDSILAPGGSADAADLVAHFLGRPYSFDSFAAWLARPAEVG